MFEKNLKMSYLIDFYGEVLDEHTRTVMKAYYDDDLSLSEVADMIGISRQGVRHVIKKGEEQLSYLEERLGLADEDERLSSAVEELVFLRSAFVSQTLPSCDEVVKKLDAVIELLSGKSR